MALFLAKTGPSTRRPAGVYDKVTLAASTKLVVALALPTTDPVVVGESLRHDVRCRNRAGLRRPPRALQRDGRAPRARRARATRTRRSESGLCCFMCFFVMGIGEASRDRQSGLRCRRRPLSVE